MAATSAHGRKHVFVVVVVVISLPGEHDIAVFLWRHPQGKLEGGGVWNIINNTAKDERQWHLPFLPPSLPPSSLSPSILLSLLLPRYSSMLDTSASALACVA